MTMKIMHTADIHLRDSQFGNPGRGADFTASVLNIIEQAHALDIQYILASGDILDSKKPSSRSVSDLLTINRKLAEYGITMVAIPGDHDACRLSWINALKQEQGLSNIEDVTDSVYEIKMPSGASITVYGAPKAKMHPEEFRQQAGEWPAATILLYHGPFKEFAGFKMPDDALSIADLPTDRYEVIALGDLHSCRYIEYNGCLIGYPGPTEYCSANEPVQKSVTVLRFDDQGHVLKFDSARDIVPIRTRCVVQKTIRTEEDMFELLQDLTKVAQHDPIVHVWHDSSIPAVFERLANVVDPRKGILRVMNKGNLSDKPGIEYQFGSLDTREERATKRVSDFVSDFAAEGDPTYDTMVLLCDPSERASTILDMYVTERLNYLTNAERTF